MDPLPQSLLFLGIIPALILWFIGLKGYEGYYSDRGAFLAIAFGIIMGLVSAAVRIIVNPFPYLFTYIVIFAFFDNLLKTMVLNIGRLHNEKKTLIYGLSFGLGFGSSFTPLLIIAASGTGFADFNSLALITFGSIGFIFFHAATATFIGYGIYIGKVFNFLLIAIALQLPFNFIADVARDYNSSYFNLAQIGLIVFGLIIYYLVITKYMVKIKQDKKRKRSN